MKATGLILIAFILLKCGSHVNAQNGETGGEDNKKSQTEIVPEGGTESYDVSATETTPEDGTKDQKAAIDTGEEGSGKASSYSDTDIAEETTIFATEEKNEFPVAGTVKDTISHAIANLAKIPQAFKQFLPFPSERKKRDVIYFPENIQRTDCSLSHLCLHKGLFRHNESCTKYYECRFIPKCHTLVPKIKRCPKCLKFNADKAICDLPENVPECSKLSSTSQRLCTSVGLFPVPHDCQKYYECRNVNGTIALMVKMCPPSAVFSQKKGICVEGKTCKRHEPKCGPGKSYLSDKFNCSVYYRCENKHAIPLVCPTGFIFNGFECEKWEESKLNWSRKQNSGKSALLAPFSTL